MADRLRAKRFTKICGYDSSRSLKGFTRPVNRVTLALRDSGDLPEEADELLEPLYVPIRPVISVLKASAYQQNSQGARRADSILDETPGRPAGDPGVLFVHAKFRSLVGEG